MNSTGKYKLGLGPRRKDFTIPPFSTPQSVQSSVLFDHDHKSESIAHKTIWLDRKLKQPNLIAKPQKSLQIEQKEKKERADTRGHRNLGLHKKRPTEWQEDAEKHKRQYTLVAERNYSIDWDNSQLGVFGSPQRDKWVDKSEGDLKDYNSSAAPNIESIFLKSSYNQPNDPEQKELNIDISQNRQVSRNTKLTNHVLSAQATPPCNDNINPIPQQHIDALQVDLDQGQDKDAKNTDVFEKDRKLKSEQEKVQAEKRRQQIQLLNANATYFQKEIRRLQESIERVQKQNEELKSRYFSAQNSKSELQATVILKTEESKKNLKQLERQRIIIVELKYQIAQKQKMLSRVILELQSSNQHLANEYASMCEKVKKLESDLKTKIYEALELERALEGARRDARQSERQILLQREASEKIIGEQSKQMEGMNNEFRKAKTEMGKEIEELKGQIESLQQSRRSEELLIEKKVESVKRAKGLGQLEKENVSLKEQNLILKAQIRERKKYISELQGKLLASLPRVDYEWLEEQFKRQEETRRSESKQHEQIILALQREIDLLKISPINPPVLTPQNLTDQLKIHMEETATLKADLATRVEEIFYLKSDFEQAKAKQQELQGVIEVLTKRLASEEKSHQLHADISTQNMQNQIDSLSRKLETTQARLAAKGRELKEKENFISSVICNRSRQQDIPAVMAEFQRIFEAEYAEKLFNAIQTIQLLQKQSS